MSTLMISQDTTDKIKNIITKELMTQFHIIPIRITDRILIKEVYYNTSLNDDILSVINMYLDDYIDIKLKYESHEMYFLSTDTSATTYIFNIAAENITINFINYSFNFDLNILVKGNVLATELNCHMIDSDTLSYKMLTYKNKAIFKEGHRKDIQKLYDDIKRGQEPYFQKYEIPTNKHEIEILDFHLLFITSHI
jgi:hypothetical protein